MQVRHLINRDFDWRVVLLGVSGVSNHINQIGFQATYMLPKIAQQTCSLSA